MVTEALNAVRDAVDHPQSIRHWARLFSATRAVNRIGETVTGLAASLSIVGFMVLILGVGLVGTPLGLPLLVAGMALLMTC